MAAPRTPRIAFYSHDSLGLGHIRRNLALAAAAHDAPAAPDALLLSGSPEVTALHRPAGCDLVTLPALHKGTDGRYGARHLSVELDELTRVRREVATAALTTFAPDVLVVDRHPRGFRGELEPALDALRGRSHVVLGLRDVLDDPAHVRDEWDRQRTADALARWYDEVWCYGDPSVHDPLAAARVPVPVAVRSTGYLAAGRPVTGSIDELGLGGGPVVAGLVGGGADGGRLAAALASTPLPEGVRGVIVTGPQMPEEAREVIEQTAAHRDDLIVLPFVPDAVPLIRRAAAVVTMGGYNTVCEVLASDTPALVVPRSRPRTEQLLRATHLAAAGHLDVLRPEAASSAALRRWIEDALTRGRHRRHGLRLDGLATVRDRIAELTAAPVVPLVDTTPVDTTPFVPARPLTQEATRAAV